jgi:asparagine synthase (glutamine-hydrolysing)
MCGIAGLLSLTQPVDVKLLERMRDAMIQSGPGGFGIYMSSDTAVGLAHRRLAVIDLSLRGSQPMTGAFVGRGRKA